MPSSRATARSDSAARADLGQLAAGGVGDLGGEFGADAFPGGGWHAGHPARAQSTARNCEHCS